MRYEIGQVLKQEQVMSLVFGRCPMPKQMLGRHLVAGGQIIAAYHPRAVRMRLLADDGSSYQMDMVERQPVFALFLPHQRRFLYRLEITLRGGETIFHYDPYSFSCQITEEEEQEFLRGRWLNAYQKMGCHPMEIDGVRGMYFAVWAPHVQCASVVGDFNQWDGRLCPMNRMAHSDIYEIFLPEVEEGTGYQYEVRNQQGETWRVADPYGVARGENHTSKMLNVKQFDWKDRFWMEERRRKNVENQPVIIRSLSGEDPSEIDRIDASVTTHVLLSKRRDPDMMRRTAYSDGGDFFVPPFCCEEPDAFRGLVQTAHQKGIGVLLEVSMEAIPCEKPQVVDFLLSNLLFWIREYHIDGFAFDGLTGDSRSWNDIFNNIEVSDGPGNGGTSADDESRRSILRQAMAMVHRDAPGVLIISDGQNLRRPVDSRPDTKEETFDFFWNYHIKWNLDHYLSCRGDRRAEHFELTLPLQKPGVDRSFVLLDYKNVNVLNQTSIDKSEEVYYDMLSEAKLSYAFLTGIPGKKILSNKIRDAKLRDYLYRLMEMYRRYAAWHACGGEEQTFEWVNGMDAVSSVISFIRRFSGEKEFFLFLYNFSGKPRKEYQVGVPSFGEYRLLLNSDAAEYGGRGWFEDQHPAVTKQSCDFRPYSMTVSLPPKSALIFGFGPAFSGDR